MRVLAISELQVGYEANRTSFVSMRNFPEDWLVLCGDFGKTVQHLKFVFEALKDKFYRPLWVLGNHELWSRPEEHDTLREEIKYFRIVELARKYNVITPEDTFPKAEFHQKSYYLALFSPYTITLLVWIILILNRQSIR